MLLLRRREKRIGGSTRIEARHETRCEEATSTSLHSKKKEARKIEPPQINNECIEKALFQLTGAVMEVGYLCWKYALEAIINWLLLYFLVHDNRLLSMLELY